MFSSMAVKFLILLIGNVFTEIQSFDLKFPSFPNGIEDQLIMNTRVSRISSEAIQVTLDQDGPRGDAKENLAGRVVYKDQFTLWRTKGVNANFSTNFTLNIADQTTPGGEGLAFILAGSSQIPADSDGQWLGIVNSTTNGSSSAQIVAIEFDRRKNFPEDSDDNHVGFDVNSVYSRIQVPLESYGLRIGNGRNQNITVRVQYNSKNITVFVGEKLENTTNQVFSEAIDLSEYLPEKVFVGFSGSTSNYTQLNCVLTWVFHGTDFDKNSSLLWIGIIFLVLVVVLLCAVAIYLYMKRRYARPPDEYSDIEDRINNSALAPRKFKLRELKRATKSFDPRNQLGQGGFGTVFKGIWKDMEIAVKRVSETSRQGKQEFVAEVTIIGSLRHRNLVKLIGWCYEAKELLLVYEYMSNNSLDKFIFWDEKWGIPETMLDWEKRLSIIHGTAQALDYLHNGSEKRVLHRDIKASNIMLDSEFNAKLGDFGLARAIQERQMTHHSTKDIAGTPGYMAPEIFLTGRATIETDIYAFGVLILEVACGRKPGNQSEQNNYTNNIVHWLWELHRKEAIVDAADSKLDGNFSEEEMECVLLLGLACCHPNPHLRPSMKAVLQVLSGEATPPELPPERPSFVWPAVPPSFSSLDTSLAGSQLTPFTDITGR